MKLRTEHIGTILLFINGGLSVMPLLYIFYFLTENLHYFHQYFGTWDLDTPSILIWDTMRILLDIWSFCFLYVSVNVYTFIKTSEATVFDEIPHQQDFPVKHH